MGKMKYVFQIGMFLSLGAGAIPFIIFPSCMDCGIISFDPNEIGRPLLMGLMAGAGITIMIMEIIYED